MFLDICKKKLLLIGSLLLCFTAVYGAESGNPRSDSINVPFTSTVSIANKTNYSNNAVVREQGSYNSLISNQLSLSYYSTQTQHLEGNLLFENNTLQLQNGSFSQTDKNPFAATQLFMANQTPHTTIDLSNWNVTLQNNTLQVKDTAEVGGMQGNLFGALVETENSQLGNLTLSGNSVVFAATDTPSEEGAKGPQLFGAEIISNITKVNTTIDVSQQVSGNTVSITGGNVNNKVIGAEILGVLKDQSNQGITLSGQVSQNVVNITKGTLQTDIVGGVMAVNSQNSSQTLYITGQVKENQVNISGGTFTGSIIAGGSIALEGQKAATDSVLTASVQDNIVNITGGKYTDTLILGGVTTADNGNTVTGAISGNTVSISGTPSFSGTSVLYGGFTSGTNAITNNTLQLNTKNLSVYGVDGFSTYEINTTALPAGATVLTSTHGNGHNNPLFARFGPNTYNGAWNIDGASINWKDAGRPALLNIGQSITLLKTNNVQGFSGTIANNAEQQSFTEGTTTYYYVLRQRPYQVDLLHYRLEDSGDWNQNISMAAGSYAGDDVSIAISGTLTASNISVTSNAQASAFLEAGTLDVSAQDTVLSLRAAQDGQQNAHFNTINLANGHNLTKIGNAFYSFDTFNISGNTQVSSLDVVSNAATVNLASGANARFATINLAQGAAISILPAGTASYSFDTLNTWGTQAAWNGDLTATGKNLNFYLDSNTVASDTALQVTGTADITDSQVKVGITGSSSALQKNDQVVLIDAGTLSGVPVNTKGVGMQGLLLKYNFDLQLVGNQLLATVTNTQLFEHSKAFSEGRIAALATLTQGADFVATQGIRAAQQAADEANHLALFSTIGAGKSRYETGSHIDVNGFQATVGLAHEVESWYDANWLLASFAEYGTGNYSSYNSFSTGTVKGSGDSSYIGLGILGKRTSFNNFYMELSARVGQVKNDFEGKVYTLENADYDYKTMYYGAHGGLGYMWQGTENTQLDLSVKYLWTHQDGKNVSLSSGDKIDFAGTNSSRVRAGLQWQYDLDESWFPYAGAAYEYELAGKAKATTYGLDIDAPSLRGGTGIGEIGIGYQHKSWLLGLSGQGYVGKRKGAGGQLHIGYMF